MIRILMVLALSLLLTQCKKKDTVQNPASGCIPSSQVDNEIVSAADISAILEEYVNKGLPGITFIARKGNHYWQLSKGLADREKNKALKDCMIWPGYSITKTYTAATILRLKEEGKIQLDQKINTCLPAAIAAKVPGAADITVRMLLNHSSGIENFWDNQDFLMSYMSQPDRSYTLDDYLQASRERLFAPGTDASYSNTNYLLLALIIDHTTGKPHAEAFNKYITTPLSLQHTYYKQLPNGEKNNSPQLYADIEGEGQLINYTDLSHVQFANEYGSNSMLASPKDFVDFFHAVTHNQLLNGNSFSEMKTWFRGSNEADVYGLGLENYDLGGVEIYGHAGSSFGGRTLLLYIPEKDLTLFIGINASAELGGPVLFTIAEFMTEMIGTILQ